MRYSLLQLILTMCAIGCVFGLIVRLGSFPALMISVLAALALFCVVRLKRNWVSYRRPHKIYALSTAVASSVLFTMTVLAFVSDPSVFCEGQIRQLQAELSRTTEFSKVQVAYIDLKITAVCVDGTVKTQRDFDVLRGEILRRKWCGLDDFWWRITIQENSITIDGFDSELFGESET